MWVVESYGPAETPEAFLSLIDNTSPVLTHAVTTNSRASRGIYVP